MFFRTVATLVSATLSLSLSANAQLAGQTVEFQTVLTAGNGNCLVPTSNADGAAVVIQGCGTNATALNSWVVPNGSGAVGPLKIFGDKCLDVTNGVNADGTKLQIWTCAAGNTNQMWIPVSDSAITWSGKNKCVDLTNGNTTDGNQVQIWDCDASNNNQKWNAVPVTTPISFVISLKKNPSLCVAASANAVNASVVIEPCSASSAAQTWSDLANANQVVIFDNLCMSPATNINDGTKLILSPCIPNDAAQQWSHETGLINNRNVPKSCLDLTNGDETPENQLQIWTCTLLTSTTDNTNQDWIVTDTF
ncbi:ricin B lectin domain-containing protein [Mycena latifolia]|nr:ricin B lectin domain-containing protein [Mycena latifolia]